MKTILFISSEPSELSPTRCSEELSLIFANKRLKRRFHRQYEIIPVEQAKGDEIIDWLDIHPNYLHYCGHGNEGGEIMLENYLRKVHTFNKKVLKDYLSRNRNIECILFCSCYSEQLIDEIKQFAKYSIGFFGPVRNADMHYFTQCFYESLFQLGSPLHAYLKTTDKILAIGRRDIRPIFRSQTNYAMELAILQKELAIAEQQHTEIRHNYEFALKMKSRIGAETEAKQKELLDLFNRLIVSNPAPGEVIWFSMVYEQLAAEIARDLLMGQSEDKIEGLAFQIELLFIALRAVLLAYDEKEESIEGFRTAARNFPKKLFINALNKLRYVKFEGSNPEEFRILLESSIDFAKTAVK